MANTTIQLDNTDEATVKVGDKDDDDNYFGITEVTDDNDDGQVHVKFNSYRAGSGSADEVLIVSGDETTIDDVEQTTFDGFGVFGAGGDILEATDYDMLTVEAHVDLAGNTSGNQEIEDEDDVGTLSLGERSSENVQMWRVPGDTYSNGISELNGDETAPVYT